MGYGKPDREGQIVEDREGIPIRSIGKVRLNGRMLRLFCATTRERASQLTYTGFAGNCYTPINDALTIVRDRDDASASSRASINQIQQRMYGSNYSMGARITPTNMAIFAFAILALYTIMRLISQGIVISMKAEGEKKDDKDPPPPSGSSAAPASTTKTQETQDLTAIHQFIRNIPEALLKSADKTISKTIGKKENLTLDDLHEILNNTPEKLRKKIFKLVHQVLINEDTKEEVTYVSKLRNLIDNTSNDESKVSLQDEKERATSSLMLDM